MTQGRKAQAEEWLPPKLHHRDMDEWRRGSGVRLSKGRFLAHTGSTRLFSKNRAQNRDCGSEGQPNDQNQAEPRRRCSAHLGVQRLGPQDPGEARESHLGCHSGTHPQRAASCLGRKLSQWEEHCPGASESGPRLVERARWAGTQPVTWGKFQSNGPTDWPLPWLKEGQQKGPESARLVWLRG